MLLFRTVMNKSQPGRREIVSNQQTSKQTLEIYRANLQQQQQQNFYMFTQVGY